MIGLLRKWGWGRGRGRALLALLLAAGCTDETVHSLADAGAIVASDASPGAGPADADRADAAQGADAAPGADASPAAEDAGAGPDAAAGPIPIRYLSANVGNASPTFGCWEYKLCRAEDVADLRAYIAQWQPDVVLLTEVYRADQFDGTEMGGPILPEGFAGLCGTSLARETGEPEAFDAVGASHEHECIGWKASRVSLVPDSQAQAYGRNDDYGKSTCGYDMTGFRVRLVVDGRAEVTAVIAHPDPRDADCRTEEIGRYWSELVVGERAFIAGDWNTDDEAQIARPARFGINFSKGQHWDLAYHPDDYSAVYALGAYRKHLDHAFSSFGLPCTDCGGFYGTDSLAFGSALGGYDGHPRADGGDGFDHRQILVDLWLTP